MDEDFSLSDSLLDAAAEKYAADNPDLDVAFVITFIEELGWRIQLISGDNQVCATGAPAGGLVSGISRLLMKAAVKIEEFRESVEQTEL